MSNRIERTAAEFLAIVTEANRLARDGGTEQERAAYHERKAALLATIGDAEHVGAIYHERKVEQGHIERAKERAKAAFRDLGLIDDEPNIVRSVN